MKKSTILISVFIVLIIIITNSTFGAAPANDMFANRITITGDSGSAAGSNVNATLETGEPQPGGTGTVWWSWTASSSGGCQFDTCGSDFDTYLAVYTGDSVDALTSIAESDDSDCGLQSKVCFETTAGQTYQIQVSGYWNGYQGEIILNWQMGGSVSEWMVFYRATNSFHRVWLGSDLSALSYKYTDISTKYYRTNDLGCEMFKYEYERDYPDGLTVENKKNKKIVDKKMIDGLGKDNWVEDYNGKQILLYDLDNKKLLIYNIKKGAFVKGGDITVNNFGGAWFEGKDIYAMTWSAAQNGLKVFDKKLKKEKWELPLADGWIQIIGKGVTARELWSGDDLKITCKKNGKKLISEHNLTQPAGYTLNYAVDRKGGILYWTRQLGTNSPLTYLDRKGKKILDNQSMTDAGNVWMFYSFDGKTLYINRTITSSNYVFYAYKLKGLSKLGSRNISIPQSGWIKSTYFDKNVYIIPSYTDTASKDAVYVFDKKLKKELWKENYAEGSVWKVGKDSLYRYTSSTSGSTVTKVYKLFNKKGEIVTYTFVYTE